MSQFLGDDHNIQASRFTVGVARFRSVTAQWPLVQSIGHILQPFTGRLHMSDKCSVGQKKNQHTIKQIKLISTCEIVYSDKSLCFIDIIML